MKINNLLNKKIAVLWFWVEGKSTLNFLKNIWVKDITILDKKSPISIDKINNINYVFWDNYLDNLWDYDLIFKTPWISPYNNSKLLKYSDKTISQAHIFFDNYKWKVVWITWTKGKSTTSTLTYELLKELWYNVKLVWNIWKPVFDEIDILSWETYDFVIYELSSYMLEWFKPELFIWLLNNLYDCHLDWHEWKNNYSNAKINILKKSENRLITNELENSVLVSNIDNKIFFWENWTYFYKNKAFCIWNKEIFDDENIALNWIHNRKNIAWVLWILDISLKEMWDNIFDNKNIQTIKNVLSNFCWLPHRQELVWTFKWITFINDAIATTPESTMSAINTFWYKIWTIFIWNEDSWFNLEKLKETILHYNIKNIVLFPNTWEKIFWDFSKNLEFDKIINNPFISSNKIWKIIKTLSMENAVKFAYENTKDWEIVLFSTWAPSFNANWTWVMPWTWYVQKWEMFKELVLKYSK